MNANRILVVDDEDKIRHAIKLYLQKEGYAVEEASNGQEALLKFEENNFSLVILDIMMEDIDGWTVCKQIRTSSSVPIIMLTARTEEYDKLFGFELGVDDYVVKPFSPKEVVARVKAILRRGSNYLEFDDKKPVQIEEIKIDPTTRQTYLNDERLNLTPKEFDLLLFLAENQDRVYTREQLLNNIWGYDFYGDLRTVDTHIKQLREKLKTGKNYIQTVWGTGYKLSLGDNHEKHTK